MLVREGSGSPGEEQTIGKVEAVPVPRRVLCSYATSWEIPVGVFVPLDVPQTRSCLEFYETYAPSFSADYVSGEVLGRVDALRQFDLLLRCHSALRLRESSYYQAAQLWHRVQERLNGDGNPQEMSQLLCALLFICQKYEPTDRSVYSVVQITQKLFGANTRILPAEILDKEMLLLELLDYRLETITPYNLIHVYGPAAGLEQRDMNLALYLITLASAVPSCQNLLPTNVAAAVVLLVLEKRKMNWGHSAQFWANRRQVELFPERHILQQLWVASWQEGRAGRPSAAFHKYANAHKYQVALEEPLFN